MKNKIINIIIIVLCLCAIFINAYLDTYEAIGAACIMLIGILAICKDTKKQE